MRRDPRLTTDSVYSEDRNTVKVTLPHFPLYAPIVGDSFNGRSQEAPCGQTDLRVKDQRQGSRTVVDPRSPARTNVPSSP